MEMNLEALRSFDRHGFQGSDREVPKRYRDVAEGMERQFVKHMIEQMDKTVERARPESSADAYYKSLFHDEIAQKVSRNGSLGLRDVILDQIYPRDTQKVHKGSSPYAEKWR